MSKKERVSEKDWQDLYYNPKISRMKIMDLVNRSVERAKLVLKDYKSIGYAWSGGKDSIVAYDILKMSGVPIKKGVFVEYYNEYPAFIKWCYDNAPDKLEFRGKVGYTLEQLEENQKLLFPEFEDKNSIASYNPHRWRVQNQFCLDHKIDVLIMGRRVDDGNFCGKREKHFLTKNKKAVDKFNIIADWTYEELLAYMRYFNSKLPPIYYWERGFQKGTHVWTESGRLSDYPYSKNWDYLMSVDESIVYDASKVLSSARIYLAERGLL